jgi:hypothetical protein
VTPTAQKILLLEQSGGPHQLQVGWLQRIASLAGSSPPAPRLPFEQCQRIQRGSSQGTLAATSQKRHLHLRTLILLVVMATMSTAAFC